MVKTIDSLGQMVYVTYSKDSEPVEVGYRCKVYANANYDYELDSFSISPDDCDCNDTEVVEAYIEGYISVQEYDLTEFNSEEV